MDFQFSGLAGWIISICLIIILVAVVLIGSAFLLLLIYSLMMELIYKIKVAKSNHKVFWYYLRNQEKIKAYFNSKDKK